MRAGTRQTPEEELLALVREHAAELLRFARRLSLCDDDAHDAYQRGLEVLVRRMRSDPPERPLSWLRTVIRHESASVRAQREQLVGRAEVDLDRHEARHLEDPGERAVVFERLRQAAEAMQRLKQAELLALLQRAEGLSYKEIAARNDWSYTKTNRAITEGRRALLERLGAIEAGAECRRWLPLLSRLADGEASAAERDQARPHLRACAGCRATLRELHDAPRTLAALVPPALALGAAGALPGAAVARHAERLAHALLARTGRGGRARGALDALHARAGLGGRVRGALDALHARAARGAAQVQSALDALPGSKLAAVAASGAALAGGGVALSQTALAPARPASARADAVPATAGALPAAWPAGAALGALAASRRAPARAAVTGEFATAGEFAGAVLAPEFALQRRPAAGGRSAPEFPLAAYVSTVHAAASAPRADGSADTKRTRRPGGGTRAASAFAASLAAPRAGAAPPASSQPRAVRSAPPASTAEFAGP